MSAATLWALSGSSIFAQQLEVLSGPQRLSVAGGGNVGPVNQVVFDARGRGFVIGGPSRLEIRALSLDHASLRPFINLSELGAQIAWPAGVVFGADGQLSVIDGNSPRWALLRSQKGRWAVDAVSTSNLSNISSACALSGKLFVMGKVNASDTSGIVHEVSTVGIVKRSFGKRFGDQDNPAVRAGHLLCTGGSIVVTSRVYPEVRAYRTNGTERWTLKLPSFLPMGFETQGRMIRFTYPADSVWDQTTSLFSPAPGVVAIQIGRQQGRSPSAPFSSVRTVFVSALTGAVLGTQLGLPMTLTAHDNRLFSIQDRSAEDLFVYRYRYKLK